jgi:hypothetical protein
MNSENKTRLLILALLAILSGVVFGKLIPDALKDSSYRKKASKGIKYLVVSIYAIIYAIIASGAIYLLINPQKFTDYARTILN